MDIKRLSATDAKNRFSDLLDAATDHPVRIDRSGKAAAYVVNAADFERVRGAAAMARIERLLASGDRTVIATLQDYSAGRLARQKAIESLMLANYGQLLDALERAGVPRPHLPRDTEEEMIRELRRLLRG